VKTGKPGPSHIVQVMVYMYAVPWAMGRHRGVVFNGHRWSTRTTSWTCQPPPSTTSSSQGCPS
jgi:hypothetical protein